MTVTNIPSLQDAGCQDRSEKRDSDLCAQWKAADAATNAANYAWWALALSAVGTFFLYITFREGRRTSRAELRAYVSVDEAGIGDGTHLSDTPLPLGVVRGVTIIKNTGQTPALKVRHWGNIAIEQLKNQHQLRGPIKLAESHYTALPTNGTMIRIVHRSRKPNSREIEGIRKGTYAVFLYGRIEYFDVFGREHHTDYRLLYTGTWPPPERTAMNFSESGNDME